MKVFAFLLIWASLFTQILSIPPELLDFFKSIAEKTKCRTLKNSLPAPEVASGYQAKLAITELRDPRQILFDKQGRLLVVDRGIGVKQFKVDRCGLLVGSTTIIEDSNLNHGLTISTDGKTLFASTSDIAYGWSYDTDSGTVSNKKALVTGMSSGGHTTRSLLVPDGNPDILLISVGSDGNFDQGTKEYSSGRSQIRGFQWKDLLSESVEYKEGGTNFGWGLRNSVGLRDDKKGQLWSVENSADNIKRDGVDVHTDNPGEELNFHGSVRDTSTSRRNYGYPSCFTAWDPSVIPDHEDIARGQQFSLDSEVDDAKCASDYQAPRLAFPAHTAPLDIIFDKAGDAWVTQHGSWNRDPPIGYQLITIPFDNKTGEPKADSSSDTGFKAIFSNKDLNSCPGRCFRPTSLAIADDGAIFMSSDSTGEIYRIEKEQPGRPSRAKWP
ncbi:hypothetical protein AOL_s00076g468 [Orbilia oligospora ATCC 24927]|uniref:Pyrroloquinoline quinone-dependent pyranose dehydrogenase beta-propeller domain-containing protein n=2 Tax=Orbilia oligospora TaxID=2813651 RepID=G1X9X9_ARTOA|nr:hypothetical protein AOL_s00076g468 [Orbilia oligospora ATCC 24927]EGX50117.1 hypothetical protein AOL_s00076g468 [Orbilia oligospora ATCC 24927]KAF3276173.1 hypothetical protein TWF970_006458 [Orbilia oligospora]